MNRPLARVALVAGGLLAGLAAGEVAARLVYTRPWYEQLIAEQIEGDAAAGARRNAFGLRDRDYATPKPAGVRRVLILGDSFTYGSGVGDDAAVFPRRLERELNAGRHGRGPVYEVLNGGIPASTRPWASSCSPSWPSSTIPGATRSGRSAR